MPKIYVKKGQTPEGTARRLRAFRHNGYLGYTSMTRRQMLTIIDSDSVTDEAAELAKKIALLATDLAEALKTRVD